MGVYWDTFSLNHSADLFEPIIERGTKWDEINPLREEIFFIFI
jgi:hypothetical protein